MGHSRYSDEDFKVSAKMYSSKTREQIFTSRGMDESLDPAKIKVREAVDSEANPETTPIILASDVTGSMGMLAEQIIKKDLGTILKELYDRKPVTDPQIMCAAIGDANCDQAPLQVTQFEADSNPLVAQLEKIYLEGGGGANMGESYSLVWYFAAHKTKCDAITKRHRKGYIFTIGDECWLENMTGDQLRRFLGAEEQSDLDIHALLKETQKNWNVFHLMVKPVSNQPVEKKWKELLEQRAILIPDIDKLAEGIVATIQVVEGATPAEVVESWKGTTAISTVKSVTSSLTATA